MILNNWWAYLAAIYSNPIGRTGQADVMTAIRSTGGHNIRIKTYISGYLSDNASQLAKLNPKLDLSFRLAELNTEPSPDEYTLGDKDITSLFSITQNFTTSWEEGKEITIGNITAINNDQVMMSRTINSICILKSITAFNGAADNFLVVRELLDEPIVVPAHGSFQRIFKWESM